MNTMESIPRNSANSLIEKYVHQASWDPENVLAEFEKVFKTKNAINFLLGQVCRRVSTEKIVHSGFASAFRTWTFICQIK